MWIKRPPGTHIRNTIGDCAPDSEGFEHDAVCPHGLLLPDRTRWKLIPETVGHRDLAVDAFTDREFLCTGRRDRSISHPGVEARCREFAGSL